MNHTITNLFSNQLVTALSSTLIHSLWQGALLSAVTGLIMTGTRKSSAARRYNLLVGAMALFAVAVLSTFIFEYNKGAVYMPAQAGQYVVNQGPIQPQTTLHPVATPSFSIAQTIGAYLNRYASAIVWVWLLMICLRCAQLLVGLRSVYSLRYKNRFGVNSYWQTRVGQMSAQLGIKRLVGIAQSASIKTPMVIGHLKPLILVPIGMLASISAQEAEAILLHELAHIQRSDYLVNLLQTLMEIVFFFNPSVLWLSALIKAERENCCDDIALVRSSKVNYIKALLACEEYVQPSPAYAMALQGSNGGLKNRVTRIISNKNLTISGREKSLLAACIIAVCLFTVAFANAEKINKLIIKAGHTVKTQPVLPKLLVLKPIGVQHQQGIKALENRAGNGKADTSTRDSVPVPSKSYTYSATQYKVQQDTYKTAAAVIATTAKPAKKALSSLTSLAALPAKPAKTAEAVKTDKVQPFDSDGQDTKAMISDLLKDGIITSTDDLSFKIGNDEFVVNYKKQPEEIHQKYRAKYVADQKNGNWDWYYKYSTDKYTAITNNNNTYKTATDKYHATANEYKPTAAAKNNDTYTQSLISDLMKDGIITNPYKLSFKIGTDEFVVNYQKQPDAVYQKYRAKYVTPRYSGKGDWIWYYSFDTDKWDSKYNAATQTNNITTGVFQGKLK